ncbi:hypothetical protein BH11BAC3_BH11BAC3_18650 [soil metagenome]
MVKLEVSDEVLKNNLLRFFPSLKQYPEKYLSLIFNDTSNVPEHMAYVCPLCLQNFIYYIPSQLRWSEAFSLDHFPPEDVNGKLAVLVCKPCNNNSGSAYESNFSELVEKECFNKKIPNSKLNTTVTISDVRGWHKGKFSIDESGQYRFGLTTNQTKNLPELAEWENSPVGDWEMNATIKHTDEIKFVKSLLKTAYLYCFNHWGYSFVFSKSAHIIRQVLNGEAIYPINIPSIWLDNKSGGIEIEKINTGVIFISEPKELQSIFVNIPVELKHLNYKCVIPIQIPNPTEECIEEIQRINRLFVDEKNVTIKMAPINFPHPGMEDSFSYTWNSLLQQFN